MNAPVQTVCGPLLELDQVDVCAGPDTTALALEAVCWAVRPGECWVVAGAAGAGKSALLETAAGLRRPVRGAQRLFGRDLGALDGEALAEVRRRVGLVFPEGGRLFAHLTVAENVALPWGYHHDRSMAEAIDATGPLLASLELAEHARVRPVALSRERRQRVALARALALHPELLLLDNPLAGLEASPCRWWLTTLRELAAGPAWLGGKRVTWVLACESLRWFRRWDVRVGLLSRERFHDAGSMADLVASPDPALQELLSEASPVLV